MKFKNHVFNKIKERKFSKKYLPILNIIEKNLNKVEYVKDHHGLKNFLFLAEESADKFEHPCFACFNFTYNEDEDESTNYLSMSELLVYDYQEIVNSLKDFFENRDEILYLEIGFKESIPSQEDNFRVFQMLKNKELLDINEAITKVKRFPLWYEAKFSKSILEEIQLLEKIEKIELNLLYQLKDDLIHQINKSLNNNNDELFYELSKKYTRLLKEINEENKK